LTRSYLFYFLHFRGFGVFAVFYWFLKGLVNIGEIGNIQISHPVQLYSSKRTKSGVNSGYGVSKKQKMQKAIRF
jgi:hypothetical protein